MYQQDQRPMKKWMMAVAFVAASIAGYAQDGAAPEERPHKTVDERVKARTERMARELGLSAEQVERVEVMNRQQATEAEKDRVAADQDRAARRAAMNARRDRYDTELKAVLTPDQYTRWQAKKEEGKKRLQDKRAERRENSKRSPGEPGK